MLALATVLVTISSPALVTHTTILSAVSSPGLNHAFCHCQGQEQLTSTALSCATSSEQKQILGEQLFPIIHESHPDLAGKITGMLLEIDNTELLHMLDFREALDAKVEEAVSVLRAHHAKEVATQEAKK